MAQNSRSARTSHSTQRGQFARRSAAAVVAAPTGFASWTKERKIYLAVGVLACLIGVALIAFSL
jgi:hypothetical protein